MKRGIVSPVTTKHAEIVKSEKDKTVIRVLGIPYGGPKFLGGKDLDGQAFSDNTDYGYDENGQPVVKTIYAYYDHALNENFGKEHIGYAKYVKTVPEGQLWDIEVSTAYRYHNLIRKLAENGYLGASSQPVQTSYEDDEQTGHIVRWHPVEISLTTHMANPAAYAQILKSLGMDEMANKKNDTQEVIEEETDVTNTEDTSSEVTEDTSSEGTEEFSNEIQEIFNTDSSEETSPDLMKRVSDLEGIVKSLVTLIEKSEERREAANKEILVEVKKTQGGLKLFATTVAKQLGFEVLNQANKRKNLSEAELDAEQDVADEAVRKNTAPPTTYIPADAPGRK